MPATFHRRCNKMALMMTMMALITMMMCIGTETLVAQLVNERSRVHANRNACNRTKRDDDDDVLLALKL